MSNLKTVITGSGSYIPPSIKKNTDFTNHHFFTENGEAIETPSAEIVEKFKDITGIEERRYTSSDVNASDMATIAAKKAIEDAAINPEELDYIGIRDYFQSGDICLVEWPEKGGMLLAEPDLDITLVYVDEQRKISIIGRTNKGISIVNQL